MKIKIKKRQEIDVEIEVNFPYYYKHDLYSDYGESIIYGKIISEKKEVTIHEKDNLDGERQYEIEEDTMSHSYFEDKYKGNKKEFEEVKQRALEFLKQF